MERRATLWAVLVVGLALFLASLVVLGTAVLGTLGGTLGGGCAGDGGPGGGAQQIGPRAWSAEQMTNAQTIVQHAVDRALPKRAAVIALSTAIVESGLENLGYGDRDSLGLFQQRPSQGWGTPEQLLNPAYAAAEFYRILLTVPRWATQPPGVAAQAVQRSAFPDRYAPQEPAAAALVERLWVGPDNPLPRPGDPGPAAAADPAMALSTVLCPDQGGSDVPLVPGDLDLRELPPDFVLPDDPAQRAAVSFALAQVGKPYVWGAKGPDAFDCSGLTTAAWAAAGVGIPAGTVNQKFAGTPVSLGQIAPGDLVFIPGSLGSPTNPRHVGIYAGQGIVVNAYSSSTGVILVPLADMADRIVTIRHIAGPVGEPARVSSPALAAAS